MIWRGAKGRIVLGEAELRRFADEGISHVQVAPVIDGAPGVEAMAPVLELLQRG